MSIPTLKQQANGTVLTLHDKPYIMLAGEVGNSNSSSVEYMEGVWQTAEQLGMNTLLLPITWDQVEPEEGQFDFSLLDGLVLQARGKGKHLVLLWFGSWKNAECMYAPAWVKTDLQRFRRGQIVKGKNKAPRENAYGMLYTTLSYLCEETCAADARAFGRLMRHLRTLDGEENTVLAVQVENETGLLGTARERSDEADVAFAADVPQDFAGYMRSHIETMVQDVQEAVENGATSGSWGEVFGSVAEEIFSAYYISRYVNRVAQAGKKEYPLPMTANCWLDKGGEPGTYPSGGPVSRMYKVWQYGAPCIDLHTPDIYVHDFCNICDEYTRRGKPLMIPECSTHSYSGPRMLYTVGHYHALCYAPFGFENMGQPFTGTQGYLFGMDVTDPLLKTPQNTAEYGWYGRTLNSLMPLLGERYGTKNLQAVCSERKDQCAMNFGKFTVYAIVEHPMIQQKDGVCLAMKLSEDECMLVVNRCGLQFVSAEADKPNLDLLSVEEGRMENGEWKVTRRLNGDEAALMTFFEPTVLKVKVFTYV